MTRDHADILVVDDTPANLTLLSGMLKARGYKVRPVPNGRLALQAAESQAPDLVLLDVNMPDLDGYEVCRRLKADPGLREIPVIFLSALNGTEDKVRGFAAGGVDYISKPFQFEEVDARIETHINLRLLRRQLQAHNQQLSALVQAQVKEISDAQHALILGLAKLAEHRDEETGAHLLRVREYCRALATTLHDRRTHDDKVDATFIENIYSSSTLHDIGKVGIPDAILLKKGPLSPDEWHVMKTHAALGAHTLEAVLVQHPGNEFVRMGKEIALSHHERWDGTGYPSGAAGRAIPLAARVFTIADVYDALRTVRPYRRPLDHNGAVTTILEGDGRTMPGHFDPVVLGVFAETTDAFAEIWDAADA